MTEPVAEEFPEYEIVTRRIADLIPYAKNSRTHTPEQVAQIVASIQTFGWTTPLLIDTEDGLIAGHGRVMAAEILGIESRRCILADGWTEEQKRAYVIADNKIAENSGWDKRLLKDELRFLDGVGFDLETTGFDIGELKGFDLYPEENEEEDTLPDIQKVSYSMKGDLWLLGSHRLMCSDSTSPDALELLFNGEKADMTFTSPPYNADTKAGQGDIFNKHKSVPLYVEGGDNMKSSEYIEFAKTVLERSFDFTDGHIFWNVGYNANSRFEYIAQLQDRLPYLIEQICWKKSSSIPIKGCFMREWEPIFVFSTDKKSLGLKVVQSNHWAVSNTNSQQEDHKACFPVALPRKAIDMLSPEIIFDPFGGSGSTMIAAEQSGCAAYLMELEPFYCDLIIRRWEAFTGEEAVHSKSGRTFKEIVDGA